MNSYQQVCQVTDSTWLVGEVLMYCTLRQDFSSPSESLVLVSVKCFFEWEPNFLLVNCLAPLQNITSATMKEFFFMQSHPNILLKMEKFCHEIIYNHNWYKITMEIVFNNLFVKQYLHFIGLPATSVFTFWKILTNCKLHVDCQTRDWCTSPAKHVKSKQSDLISHHLPQS